MLAHELTHTIQQAATFGPTLPRGPPGHGTPHIRQRTGALAVQREEPSTFDRVTGALVSFGTGAVETVTDVGEAAVETVTDAGEAAVELAGDALSALVDEFAPGLLAFLRGGAVGQLTDLFCSGLDFLVSALLSPLEDLDLVSAVESTFTSLTEGINDMWSGLGAGASAAVGAVMRPLVEALEVYGDPIIQGMADAADTADSIFSGLWENVGVPVMDFLEAAGGAIWQGFNDMVDWIVDITAPLQEAAAEAWEWVCEQFDLAWESTGGIRQWLSDTASDLWDEFLTAVEPIQTPLMVIGGTLLLLSPLGPIIVLTQIIPPVYEKLVWLWNNWNTDDILVSARETLANEILPGIISLVGGVGAAIAGAASWLAGTVAAVVNAFAGLLGVVGTNECLTAVNRILEHVEDQFDQLADWAENGFKGLGDAIAAVFNALVALFQPILDFIVRLIIVAANPPLLPIAITAAIWLLCPDDLKPPVINFVLDFLIQFIRLLPSFLMGLGPLGPIIKAAALGFLQTVRNQDDQLKIDASNKIANLAAGGGIQFIAGFAVGLLEGLLDGILDPFRLIWMLIQFLARLIRGIGDLLAPMLFAADPTLGAAVTDFSTSVRASIPPPAAEPAAPADAAASTGTPGAETGPTGPAPPEAITSTSTTHTITALPSPASSTDGAGGSAAAAPAAGTSDAGPSPEDVAFGEVMAAGPMASDADIVASLSPGTAASLTGAAADLDAAHTEGATGAETEARAEGSSVDGLAGLLAGAWTAIIEGATSLGGRAASALLEFIMLPDYDLGNKIGYVAGLVLLELIIAYFSGGVSVELKAAEPFIKAAIRFLDLGGEILGLLGRAIRPIRGPLLRGLSAAGEHLGRFRFLQPIIQRVRRAADVLFHFGDEAADAASHASHGTGRAAGHADDAARHVDDVVEHGDDAARHADDTLRHGDDAGRHADDAGRHVDEAGEHVDDAGRRTHDPDAAARKAAEMPAAVAAARGICEANDRIDTPPPIVLAELLGLKSRFTWIETFRMTPKTPGRYEIHMIASDTIVDHDYTFFRIGNAELDELITFWQREVGNIRNPTRQIEAQRYLDDLIRARETGGALPRPRWWQSEAEVAHFYDEAGGVAESPFIHGRDARRVGTDRYGRPIYERGHTRPDITLSGAALEVKNYRLTEPGDVARLSRELRRQIGERHALPVGTPPGGGIARGGLPFDISRQGVIIDARGQGLTDDQLRAIADRLRRDINQHLDDLAGRADLATHPGRRLGPDDIQIITDSAGRVPQPKLHVARGGDRFEAEADRMADAATRRERAAAPPSISRVSAPGPSLVGGVPAPRSSGAPLPGPTRRHMESRFATGLDHVRIHTDAAATASARRLGARAFTTGSDIYFGSGQYQPSSASGARLLAHELTHVVQQSGGSAGHGIIQRQPAPDAATPSDAAPAGPSPAVDPASGEPIAASYTFDIIEDEKPKHAGWLDYAATTRKNRMWFQMLSVGDVNPFDPYDPFDTPNAFINRVVKWQASADKAKFPQLVFSADNQKSQDSGAKIAQGVVDAHEKSLTGGKYTPGPRLSADGVLGARTLWVMLAAAALAKKPENRRLLEKEGVDIAAIETLQDDTRPEWGYVWRAVHGYLFTPPKFQATWSILSQSDIVVETFEESHGLNEASQVFLEDLFFPEGLPDGVTVEERDLFAILARGYVGQAVEGVASLFEVDRHYYNDVDIQRLLREKRPEWKDIFDLRMGAGDWEHASDLIDAFSIEIPSDPKAQSAYEKLQEQTSSNLGTLTNPDGKLTVLAVVFALPRREPGFWPATAKAYLDEKKALEEAAEKATDEHFAELQKKFETRMAGTPDIGKDDPMAFLELLVGPAFTSAQQSRLQFQTKDAAKSDVAIDGRLQASTSAAKASQAYARAEQEGFVVVQLGEKEDSRFPLPFAQIEQSRENATRNGKSPLEFDLIDTPHAAMHTFLPTRFTARSTSDGGSEAASNPYELTWDSELGIGSGNAWENWAYQSVKALGTFDPVLIEIREFNPDAGQLVRLWRQTGGTDKVVVRYVWTLGGSLPELSKKLWDAQGTVNLFGWIDAILTLAALGSLVAAPMIAGAEVGASTAASQAGRAAINAAMRQALVRALKKFIIQEAIGEGLGRLTYHINDDPSVPDAVKKAWNGLMFAVLIYGVGSTVRQGIKSFKTRGSVKFRAEVAALEAQLEAEGKINKPNASVAEQAAQADIRKKTSDKFKESVGADAGPDSGPGRVRTDDPRVTDAVRADKGPISASYKLANLIGEDAAKVLAEKLSPGALQRLATIADNAVIKKLVELFPPEALGGIIKNVSPEVLGKLGKNADDALLKSLLEALAGHVGGVDLLRAFAGEPAKLGALLKDLTAKRLIALGTDPGGDKLFRVAALADTGAIVDTLKNIHKNADTQLARFRQLINDVGPEMTAQILNTYTGKEIGAANRWKRSGQMSSAQNVASLAIKRGGEPTKARAASGIPIRPEPPRLSHLLAADFKAFVAVGASTTLPASVRRLVAQVQEASAKAANHLNELIEKAAAGKLTDVDTQSLPPGARATVEAFLRAGPDDTNRAALYGSALQYLAEAELRAMFGGALPPGVALRRVEVRRGKTLIPDAQLELTLVSDLKDPKNKTERAVIDWTTAGEAGKITKYAGGKPPVTFAVEIIQPGPPPVPPTTKSPLIITPKMPDAPPDTDVAPPSK